MNGATPLLSPSLRPHSVGRDIFTFLPFLSIPFTLYHKTANHAAFLAQVLGLGLLQSQNISWKKQH
jgi:hypothetical protein